jgi:hypothetical protein
MGLLVQSKRPPYSDEERRPNTLLWFHVALSAAMLGSL